MFLSIDYSFFDASATPDVNNTRVGAYDYLGYYLVMKHIVIVGGGFGGIRLARLLAKNPRLFKVTLVSDDDCFRYYPALYRSAAGHSKKESCIAVELLIHDCKNVTFVLGQAKKIKVEDKILNLSDGSKIQYDSIIFALGVKTNYFNIPGMEEYSHGLKTEEELDRLRQDIHQKFLDDKQPDDNYVVVGGGATGVEISASLRLYLKKVAIWHGAKDSRINLELIEAAPRILPKLSQKASNIVKKRLESLDVTVMEGLKVASETKEGVHYDGKMIASRMVIWTAGVVNNPFYKENSKVFKLNERGKVRVDEYMQSGANIYVIGDNADTPYSGVAVTALRDAEYIASCLVASEKGRSPSVYKQKEPITIMPIGANWAFIQFKSLIITGWLGSIIHSLYDLRVYAKIMPFWQAYHLWRASVEYEEECEICARAQWSS